MISFYEPWRCPQCQCQAYSFVLNTQDRRCHNCKTVTPEKKETPMKTYIVWCHDGPTNPSVVHKTYEAAHQAAGNMSTRHVGQVFHVMESKTSFVTFGGSLKEKNPQTGQWEKPNTIVSEETNLGQILNEVVKKRNATPKNEPSTRYSEVFAKTPYTESNTTNTAENTNMFKITFQTDVKINAIRCLREITSIGLKEAKDAIENGLVLDSVQLGSFITAFEINWYREHGHLTKPIILVRVYQHPKNLPYIMAPTQEIKVP